MKEALVSHAAWEEIWRGTRFGIAPEQDEIRAWLEQHFEPGTGTCLELGCFPGRYSAVFGRLGYELHGIDMTPGVDGDLPAWMRQQGYRVGNFVRADLLRHKFARRYDVVCSFGLIEHFEDWPELLKLHASLVADGGRLVVSTPNFRGGIQQFLHRLLDGENLRGHNLQAMMPARWGEIVRPLGFDVVTCGYVGRFRFWIGAQNWNKAKSALMFANRKLEPLWRRLPYGKAAYSPYCGLIAGKK